MRLLCNFVNVYTKLVNTNMADNNITLMILTWFSVTVTSQLVMAVAACNVNLAKRVHDSLSCIHVYTRASLIHSPNPNPD